MPLLRCESVADCDVVIDSMCCTFAWLNCWFCVCCRNFCVAEKLSRLQSQSDWTHQMQLIPSIDQHIACGCVCIFFMPLSIIPVNLPAVAVELSVVHHCLTNWAFPMYRTALHRGIHSARSVSLRIPVGALAVAVNSVGYTAVADSMSTFEHFAYFDYNWCGS